MILAVRSSAFCDERAMKCHAGQHGGDEDRALRQQQRKRRERRPRAEAGQAPAYAEQRRPADERGIDVAARRQVKARSVERTAHTLGELMSEGRHRDRAGQHEGQGRVPRARDVEETEHALRARRSACAAWPPGLPAPTSSRLRPPHSPYDR